MLSTTAWLCGLSAKKESKSVAYSVAVMLISLDAERQIVLQLSLTYSGVIYTFVVAMPSPLDSICSCHIGSVIEFLLNGVAEG